MPVTAHPHGTPAMEQAIAIGVDGIEHCSCLTDRGVGQVSDETPAAGSGTACLPRPVLRAMPPALLPIDRLTRAART
jgi:imidazolonepropionase-like amidohydrolase